MSLFVIAAILLLVFAQSVLSQATGIFTIRGQTYCSENQQYDAIYIYDQSRGSPAPFNFTCTSTQGTLLDVRTTNELISLQSLIGTRVVNNVTITGTSSPVTLSFDPEFLPQFSGIYSCINEGQNFQEAVIITTENPFLRLNMRPVTVTESVDMFNITVMGAYTASGGVSLKPALEDYSLVYLVGGESVVVQDLMFVMDLTPYEQVFLVDVGQNVQNGTNFNLTLSVSGLTTSVIFPVIVPVCQQEMDMGYGIPWDSTLPGETSLRSCGAGCTGNATRYCRSDATWAPPDVLQCESMLFAMLRITAEDFYSNVTVVDGATLAMALDIVSELTTLTEPTTVSIFPRDLNISNYIITNTVDLLVLSLDQGVTMDIIAIMWQSTAVVGVIDNLLNQVNLAGFGDLQAEAPAGQNVLNNAERYALYLATVMSQNTSERGILLSKGKIVFRSERITMTNGTQPTDVMFPQEVDLENFTISSGLSPAVITIPAQLIVEGSNSSTVAVAHILFQNLQDFLPPELNNSTAVPASLIISSQVAAQSGEGMNFQTLQEYPVMVTFIVERAAGEDFTCVFWNFSEPIGSGAWSTDGVTTTVQAVQNENITFVQCNSTHLSSFAVLSIDVNMTGTPVNNTRLHFIAYIGLAVSLTCLLLTIIFFLSLGKKLFEEVHNLVHLNLAIALFAGYLTFAIGVELATSNKAACQSVTAISQYFLLASFCWMLCEGIMAYLMLVLVFSDLSKKWWFFLILGWTPPIVFVIIGLTTVLDEYVVYLRNDAGEILTDSAGNGIIIFCWLSSRNGASAIWIFAGPTSAIFLITGVFLVLILVNLYRYHKSRIAELEKKGSHSKVTVALVKSSIVLFPLFGLTWVLGVFAVYLNTGRISIAYMVINSVQGVFIFFFHVLRSERVWGQIKKKYGICASTHRKSGKHGSSALSGGSKAKRVTNSTKSIRNGDMAALMILESTVDEKRPLEKEVKRKTDPTSDEPASVAVETVTVLTETLIDRPTGGVVEATVAEAVLTDYTGAMPVVEEVMEDVGSGEQVIIVNLLAEVNEQEQLTVVEANKGDLTSDQLSSDAVETTAAEAVLTDCKESIPVAEEVVEEVGLIGDVVEM